jgi:hypothetical protein
MRRFYNIAECIFACRPGAQFAVYDDDYEKIQWYSEDITIPTLEELNEKKVELEAKEPMRCLREIRNHLISLTDWTQGADIRTMRGPEWCAAWDVYRQELRDITITQTPYFENDNDMHLSGVVWPTIPNIK